MNENKIPEVWNEETKAIYTRMREENLLPHNSVRVVISSNEGEDSEVWDEGTLEHLDAAVKLKRVTKEMECPTVHEKGVEEGLRKLKNKKAAGPDKMKGEFYKALQDSEKFVQLLTEGFKDILEKEQYPKSGKIQEQ